MKKVLALLLFLLFLLLVWLAWGWYRDTVACCEETPPPAAAVQYGPLIFDCTSDGVITHEGWPGKKQEILAAREEGKKLLLSGPYFGDENPSVGVARAEKVKALFTELPPDDILVESRPGGDCEASRTSMLHGLRYGWVTRNEDVIESLDEVAILYRYDSDQEIMTPAVEAYSAKLADLLRTGGGRAILTGHTDADGQPEYNLELGMKRAREFKDHLVRLGVDESRIEVRSKGETEPVAPNDTEEGKQKNRRVTVRIEK